MKQLIGLSFLFIFVGVFVDTKSHEHADVRPVSERLVATKASYDSFRSGDLVFRNGKGFISDLMRKTSRRDRKYSHVGILLWEGEVPMVYHMIDAVNTNDRESDLVKESLDDFCSSAQNHGFAVYRFIDMNAHQEASLKSAFKSIEDRGVKFDDHFSMDSDQRLYCTELVLKSLLNPFGIEIKPSRSPHGPYIGLDDLYLCNQAKLIHETKFLMQ